jgi:uncharacterized RDD family membrane protein YckC
MAWALDAIVIAVLIAAYSVLASLFAVLIPGIGTAVLIVGVFLIYEGYFAICEWYFAGRTLGKKVLCLRVIGDRGLPISFLQSVLRNVLREVDGVMSGWWIGGISSVCHPHAKRLGDLVAGTVVVRFEPRTRPTEILPSVDRYNVLLDDAGLCRRLRAGTRLEERRAIIELCLRRDGLRLDVRGRLFARAAEHFRRRFNIPSSEFQSDERLIQNIAAVLLPPEGGQLRMNR